jgi:hypothetical protein
MFLITDFYTQYTQQLKVTFTFSIVPTLSYFQASNAKTSKNQHYYFFSEDDIIKQLLSDLVWEVLDGGGGPDGDPHSGGRGELLLGLRAQRVP